MSRTFFRYRGAAEILSATFRQEPRIKPGVNREAAESRDPPRPVAPMGPGSARLRRLAGEVVNECCGLGKSTTFPDGPQGRAGIQPPPPGPGVPLGAAHIGGGGFEAGGSS